MFTDESKDWCRSDILAEIKKKKGSLAALSLENGLAPGTLGNVFYRAWPRGERIIADAIGTQPEKIWPSRYAHIKMAVQHCEPSP